MIARFIIGKHVLINNFPPPVLCLWFLYKQSRVCFKLHGELERSEDSGNVLAWNANLMTKINNNKK